MSDTRRDVPTLELIGRLAAGLRPVRRLRPPAWRAAWWLALVCAAGIALALAVDLRGVVARISAQPDMWLSVVGSATTAVAAAMAAMMLAMPDRDGRWALAPLPPALLWLGASGLGCVRGDAIALVHPASFADATRACLPFILKTSVVLALPLGLLLWRAKPLRLASVAWTGGLAVAAGSATLLWLCHPYDASVADLIVHAAAVGLVMLCGRTVSLVARG